MSVLLFPDLKAPAIKVIDVEKLGRAYIGSTEAILSVLFPNAFQHDRHVKAWRFHHHCQRFGWMREPHAGARKHDNDA